MRDKPKEFGGNIPWTRIEDIEGKYLNDSLLQQYVSEETINQMNLKIIPKDSLIVSTSATFGVVAIVTQDLITNQTFIGLVPKDKETLNYWYIFFHSGESRRYMKLESAGSTIFYITRESFEKMPIMVPSKNEMYKLGTYFDNLDNLITLHQRLYI
ncbi:MAG: restriction endonuclease subunit S [Intestinibaculum porci]|uniref:restriction endonuclease subunit S n=1 Tax=Intestinibaculum porci TaxID=2487118 RepID=UPI003F0C4D15